MGAETFALLMFILGLSAGALLMVARYATECGRIASFLRQRDAASNARVAASAGAPGLAALIDAINAELDRAARVRIDGIRHQQEFQRDLSALSHDIRTPLTGAKGYLQLATSEADASTRARHLAAATARIDATAELLDQLFAYTKSTDPDLVLTCEPVAVQPVVENVLIAHYLDFEARGWEPAVAGADAGARAEADRDALTRIVENLVVNALRHGADAPRIALQAANPAGSFVTLTVANRVAEPEAIDPARLFERFYQADSARGTSGSGLGLAVAHNLARAMGGTLTAHLEGDALVFELTLPSA